MVNDTNTDLVDVVVSEPGDQTHPMTVGGNSSSGHYFGLAGRIPEHAVLTWREVGSEDGTFQLSFSPKDLLPTEIASRLCEVVFVITGPRSGYLEFSISTGQYSTERYIPNEEPIHRKHRIATQELAELARTGAESGFEEIIAEGGRLNPESFLDPVPVYQAVLSGNVETVDTLLNLGSLIENEKYRTSALNLAINTDNTEVAEFLIRREADVNFVCANNTPLIIAAKNGFLQLGRLLIDHGADPDLLAMLEFPLIAAIREGNAEFVSFLLCSGADPTRPFMGRRLVEMAREFRQYDVEIVLAGWIDAKGLNGSLPTRGEALFAHFSEIGLEPVLVQAGHTRFSGGSYVPPDHSFRLVVPVEIGEGLEVIEQISDRFGTGELRLFADSGLAGAVVISNVESESYGGTESLFGGIQSSATALGTPFEFVTRSNRLGQVLHYSLLNEKYDDVGFPYGTSYSSIQDGVSTIGVGAYFLRNQRLYQIALVIPFEVRIDAETARREGDRILGTFLNGLSFSE